MQGRCFWSFPNLSGLRRHHAKTNGWPAWLKLNLKKDFSRHECGPARHGRQGAKGRSDHVDGLDSLLLLSHYLLMPQYKSEKIKVAMPTYAVRMPSTPLVFSICFQRLRVSSMSSSNHRLRRFPLQARRQLEITRSCHQKSPDHPSIA